MDATNIVTSAQSLIANHSKKEIVVMARAMGWRGDDARAPQLQIALYVATKLQAGERPEKHEGRKRELDAVPEWMGKPDQSQLPPGPADSDASSPSELERDYGPKEGGQADAGQADEGADDAQEGGQEAQGDAEGGQPNEGMPQPRPDDTEPEEPEENEPENEFAALVKAADLKSVHPLLEKLWRLTVKASQNVLLIGPAGSGKTMLAAQLAELLRLPFSSVSCTMGMSESQLSGWLLPVGDGGRFEYVPAPFVESLQTPSVFLLDELDAADPNVLMLLNSVMSNGFLTIPHKLGSPTVLRHPGSIVVAGANTTGSGADDLYSARAALDAATVDRFYPMAVDYDAGYESSLFNLGRKAKQKTAPWECGPKLSQDTADTLRDFFTTLRAQTRAKRVNRVVSSRFAQRLVAAAKARIPVEEIKADLRLTWTADELARVGL